MRHITHWLVGPRVVNWPIQRSGEMEESMPTPTRPGDPPDHEPQTETEALHTSGAPVRSRSFAGRYGCPGRGLCARAAYLHPLGIMPISLHNSILQSITQSHATSLLFPTNEIASFGSCRDGSSPAPVFPRSSFAAHVCRLQHFAISPLAFRLHWTPSVARNGSTVHST